MNESNARFHDAQMRFMCAVAQIARSNAESWKRILAAWTNMASQMMLAIQPFIRTIATLREDARQVVETGSPETPGGQVPFGIVMFAISCWPELFHEEHRALKEGRRHDR